MTSDGIRTIPSPVWKDAGIDGPTIREAREAHGFTQRELAEELAVDPRTIGLWERDVSVPQPSHRARLTEILNLDLEPDDGDD